MRIKIINPNTTQAMTDTIGACARRFARPGTEILSVSPNFGPASIESYVDEFVSACGVLDEIKTGDAGENVDAYIIACYGDPGLHAARELTERPVIGIAEASLYMASMLAARFSIVTIIPRARTLMEEMVRGYGMEHRVVSIRTLPLYVLDVEKDAEGSFAKIRDGARLAVKEDNAEAICLGCAGFAEFAQSIEDELGVPVLDGVVCATKQAELMVELGKKTSKRMTYRPPERKAYSGMFAHFSSDRPAPASKAAAE
jgi:allantoin racemase